MVLMQWFNDKIRPHMICGSSSSSCSNYLIHGDILKEILCRLPTDSLPLLKTVCRGWNSIISSRDFRNLHLNITIDRLPNRNISIHITIFMISSIRTSHIFGIYSDQLRSSERSRRKEITRRISLPGIDSKLKDHQEGGNYVRLLGSCDGLLIFDKGFYGMNKSRTCIRKNLKRIFVLNPITRETRIIKYPQGCEGYVCDIFFDRFKHEHALLHVSKTNNSLVLYHIFSFTESAWRRIEITTSITTTPLTTLEHVHRIVPPCMHACPPVIVDDALHWIVDDDYDAHESKSKIVVAFKIETNEIYHFPHPRRKGPSQQTSSLASCGDLCSFKFMEIKEEKKQLIEKNEKLCFCHIIFQSHEIHMWILEEYEAPSSWVKRFKVKLPYVSDGGCHSIRMWGSIILSFPHKDVIVVKWKHCKIYLYDLVTHKSTSIDDSPISTERCPDIPYRFIAFNQTLISPNISYK
ncbi:hypothetical protein LIER_23194 [Lithospermum erythrorhizon]|uniref:F-box domain-containing protein n=1 Tax=Lithospermum erythrorhizon TaxID=34254 RepID=A0AAV3QWI5_LITER